MRRLSLHASALNDEEYELYTASIADLALSDEGSTATRDDAYYEGLIVSVREVRAWLRGRYPEIGGTIDTILHFFSPGFAHTDSLSGGQFFAALRLVLHAQSGKDVDRALAFVQVFPKSFSAQHPPVHPSQNNPFLRRNKSLSSRSEGALQTLPPLPPRKPPPPPRPPSASSSTSTMKISPSSTPVSRSAPPTSTNPTPPPLKPKPVLHRTSTLIKQSLQASKVAQTMKKAEEQLEKERVLQVLHSTSGNSFRASGSRSPTKRIPIPRSDSSASYSGSDDRERPPLPKRKPQPPPRQQQQPSPPMSTSSLEQVALAVVHPSTTNSRPLYTPSPFDSPEHSPNLRSSELPPPTHPGRKSYSGISYQMPTSTPTHEEIPPFKRNLETFEAIYGTATGGSDSTTTPTPDSPLINPGIPRVYRSKSLHHQSHPPPPPPPPPTRRKRPESVQVLSNGEVLFGTSKVVPNPDLPGSHKTKTIKMDTPLRRSSLSASFGTSAFSLPSSSTLSSSTSTSRDHHTHSNSHTHGAESLQKTLAGLQLKAENARFKAEAGLSRRGFIPESRNRNARSRSRHGHSSLNGNDREGLMNEREQYDDADVEVEGDVEREFDDPVRDEMKWPTGEGWKML